VLKLLKMASFLNFNHGIYPLKQIKTLNVTSFYQNLNNHNIETLNNY
jgi:hypothetical protein